MFSSSTYICKRLKRDGILTGCKRFRKNLYIIAMSILWERTIFIARANSLCFGGVMPLISHLRDLISFIEQFFSSHSRDGSLMTLAPRWTRKAFPATPLNLRFEDICARLVRFYNQYAFLHSHRTFVLREYFSSEEVWDDLRPYYAYGLYST